MQWRWNFIWKLIFHNVGLLLFQILNNCARVIVIDKQGTPEHLSTETFPNKAPICRHIQHMYLAVWAGGFPKFNMFHCVFCTFQNQSVVIFSLWWLDGQASRCFSHQAQLQPIMRQNQLSVDLQVQGWYKLYCNIEIHFLFGWKCVRDFAIKIILGLDTIEEE